MEETNSTYFYSGWSLWKTIKNEARFYPIGDNPGTFKILSYIVFKPAFFLDAAYRVKRHVYEKHGWNRFGRAVTRLLDFLIMSHVSSLISTGATIGEGFYIQHGMGIVIGRLARIGNNVKIFNGVTLGNVRPGEKGQPQVGNNCVIGTGAKLLGDIRIGDNVNIGANAVVLKSFGSNLTLVGVPAQAINKSGEQENAAEEV
jgi:serine O-acetyltransferase